LWKKDLFKTELPEPNYADDGVLNVNKKKKRTTINEDGDGVKIDSSNINNANIITVIHDTEENIVIKADPS